MKESPVLGTILRQKKRERDQLQHDVDVFHEKGGKTQHLKPGESSGFTTELHAAQQRRKQR